MANEKVLNTRIQLKYDTWDNWNSETGKNVKLRKGEIAFVSIPAKPSPDPKITTAPTILFKVGDGETLFEGLKWGSATAADVYAWAKQAELPVEVNGTGVVTDIIFKNTTSAHPDGALVVTKKTLQHTDITDFNAAVDNRITSKNEVVILTVDLETGAVPYSASEIKTMSESGKAVFLNVSNVIAAKPETSPADLANNALIPYTSYWKDGQQALFITSYVSYEYDGSPETEHVIYSTIAYQVDETKQLDVLSLLSSSADLPGPEQIYSWIAAEQTRAEAAEQANADAIAVLNDTDQKEGSVAYAVAAEAKIARAAESANKSAASAAQTKADTADDHAVDAQNRVGKIEKDYLKTADKTALEKAITAEETRATGVENTHASKIEALEKKVQNVVTPVNFIGVTTTEITDGSKISTVTIDGKSHAAVKGDIVIYKNAEFVFDGSKWIELGDTTADRTDINNNKKAIEAEVKRAEAAEALLETKVDAVQKLTDAKNYADGLASNYDAAGTGATEASKVLGAPNDDSSKNTVYGAKKMITEKDAAMNTRVGNIEAKVTGWDTAAGKANSALQKADISEGSTQGAITVKNTTVKVHGLKSAAYTESTAYATAAQGKKADSALQEITTTENKGLKVTGKNNIDIDDTVTFVFDCGSATVNIDDKSVQ